MFSVLLSNILHSKIVNKKGERYWSPVVFTIDGGDADIPVSHFVYALI